jgi:hypothetical protein
LYAACVDAGSFAKTPSGSVGFVNFAVPQAPDPLAATGVLLALLLADDEPPEPAALVLELEPQAAVPTATTPLARAATTYRHPIHIEPSVPSVLSCRGSGRHRA